MSALKVLILACDFNSSILKIIAIHVKFKMDKDGISEWHLLLQLILVNRLKLSISENCLSRQLICRHVKMLFLTGDFNSSVLKIISIHVKFKTYKFSFILVNVKIVHFIY